MQKWAIWAIVVGAATFVVSECMNQWREQSRFDIWRKDHEWFMDCVKTDRMKRGL